MLEEKSEIQQNGTESKQSVPDKNTESTIVHTEQTKEDVQDFSAVRDILLKQEQVLESISKSLLKAEQRKEDVHKFSVVRDILLKQEQVLESISTSLSDMKENSTHNMSEPDGLSKDVLASKKENASKLTNILQRYGYESDESSDGGAVNWDAPL